MKKNTFSDFMGCTTGCLETAFGARLLGIVQLGSLAHGGFSERFSDIDIAVVLREPVADTFIEAVKQEISALEPAELAKRVSLFWTVPDFSWGRLRPVDQADLVDNGLWLWSKPPPDLAPRPSLASLREDMRVSSLPYWSEKTYYFAEHVPGSESDFKEFVRCLLYPARLLFTWHKGKLGSNDEAVEFVAEIAGNTLRLDMIRDALRCRHGEIEDARLFPYQSGLIEQRLASLRLLGLDQETI